MVSILNGNSFRNPTMRPQVISVGIIAILLAGAAYLQFSHRERPLAPSIPIVTGCPELRPGIRRIGRHGMGRIDEQVGFQFDVAINNFTVTEGCADAPPNNVWFRHKT